jgi:tryptophanyl-tRNA synthetase
MIVTGIQPTGTPHIGNYLGAIKPLIALQAEDEDTYAFVADYHAITADFDPKALRSNSIGVAALLVASGFDTSRGRVFFQSDIPEHLELAHILGCTAARVGQLNRMTTFREKMDAATEKESGETPSLGLYSYPVLQAADILAYQDDKGKPTRVPVGSDQSQHLNFAIDVAQSFNHRFGQTFIIPEPVISCTPRIMSLFDASKKMSKSDPDDMNRINLTDDADRIRKKFRKATSDSLYIPLTVEEIGDRAELRNLLTIYGAFAELTFEESLDTFAGKGFGPLKAALTDVVVEKLEPIQTRYRELIVDPLFGHSLRMGAMAAGILAAETTARVRETIGLSDSAPAALEERFNLVVPNYDK